jgi:hypothetical protein
MTEHATPNTTPPAADLFEIIRTTRSMRRVKPDPVPNDLIRKILAPDPPDPLARFRGRARELLLDGPRAAALRHAVVALPGPPKIVVVA